MEKSASRRQFLQDMTALGAAGGVTAALGAEGARAEQSTKIAQAQPAAPAMRAADATCSKLAVGQLAAMLSRTVPENRKLSCRTTPVLRRR